MNYVFYDYSLNIISLRDPLVRLEWCSVPSSFVIYAHHEEPKKHSFFSFMKKTFFVVSMKGTSLREARRSR